MTPLEECVIEYSLNVWVNGNIIPPHTGNKNLTPMTSMFSTCLILIFTSSKSPFLLDLWDFALSRFAAVLSRTNSLLQTSNSCTTHKKHTFQHLAVLHTTK